MIPEYFYNNKAELDFPDIPPNSKYPKKHVSNNCQKIKLIVSLLWFDFCQSQYVE